MGHSSSSHVVEDVPVRQLSERRVRGLGEHLSPRLLQALREAVGSETPRDPLHSHLLHSTALHYSVSPSTMGDFLRDLADAALSLATDPITPSDMHRLLAFLAVVPYESDLTVEQDDAQRAQALAGQLSPNAIVSWYSTSLHIKALWNQLVNTLVLDKEPTTLPAYGSNILTPVDVFSLHLSLDLSPLKKKWSRVFSTETHGKSWTVFTDQVAWPQSSLVIVKDKNEYVFGGMGSKPWDPAPNFFGDTECRLFSLQPRLRVYRPSGLNNHYQYFEAHARTLVNGLGFGGQMEYFGLWIDDTLETGSCRGEPRSTTYNNPVLSSMPDFKIDTVEVWNIQDREKDDRLLDKESRHSVLDTGIGESALLEMAGKTMYSKDVKEQKIDFDYV